MKSEHESDVEHVRRSSRQMSKNCVILLLKRDGSTTPTPPPLRASRVLALVIATFRKARI